MSLNTISADILYWVMDIETIFELRFVSRYLNHIWLRRLRSVLNDPKYGIAKFIDSTRVYIICMRLPMIREINSKRTYITSTIEIVIDKNDVKLYYTHISYFSIGWIGVKYMSPNLISYIKENIKDLSIMSDDMKAYIQ